MNPAIFRKIVKLCEEFKEQSCITPTEYATAYVSNEDEDVLFHFLNLQRHNQILQEIVKHFIKYNAITIKLNMIRFKVLFYILIFALDEDTRSGIEKIFIISNKITNAGKVLLYYLDEKNQILTAEIASKFFENDYVLTNFVNPILQNKEQFESIFKYVQDYETSLYRKESTIPIEMNVSKKTMQIPPAPVNTPAEMERFKSTPPPKTTYRPDLTFQKNLLKEYEKNRMNANELLEKARNMPDFGKSSENSAEDTKPKPQIKMFKRSKKMPIKKEVAIKPNLTTIMREAALYAKEKESCIRDINEILKGGVDVELVKTLEEKIREEEEIKQIEEIERKKLKCLLSHEEAIIAKCKLKATNKAKYYEMLEEKEELKKKLLEWKKKEEEIYKKKVEKAQESNRNAKESERKMVEDKQSNARLVQWESKMLLTKAMEEKEKELARKMHIIQEIKAMQQVRKLDISKEFDRTESSNLGLLCEMSIAELEERLYLLKLEAERQLEEKREFISKKKEEKCKMVQEAKEFIEQHRSVRVKPQKREKVIANESEDIKRLKEKVAEAKRIREACQVCPCRPCPQILAHDRNID